MGIRYQSGEAPNRHDPNTRNRIPLNSPATSTPERSDRLRPKHSAAGGFPDVNGFRSIACVRFGSG